MVSYLVCALAYAVLLIACLTLWRRRLTGSGITAAVAAEFGWAVVIAVQGRFSPAIEVLVIPAEYLRDLAWALVLIRCLSNAGTTGAGRIAQRALSALVVVVTLWALGSFLPGEPGLLVREVGRYWLWGGFLLAITGLVLVEQVARNTRATQRWSLKYLWLAIGAIYAWDLCLYSVAMLHGSLAAVLWADRGVLNAALAVLLAISFSRIPEWESAAFLSPRG